MLTKKRIAGTILAVILIAGLGGSLRPAGAQDGLFPQLFAPTGTYGVGRTTYMFTDESRGEVHTPDDDSDLRELVVDVWYPADIPIDSEPAYYLQTPFADLLTQMYGIPDGRMQAIRSNAAEDAPVAAAMAQYPVLILDPGFSGSPRQYTVIAEELASQGYVVFGMTHPYVTLLTVYPDGRTVEALNGDRLRTLWAPYDMYDGEFAGAWVPDTMFVVEQIAALNADDPKGIFTGKLETDRYGMLGHSQGARTVSQVCYLDDRCAAVINMDGSYSAEIELDFDKPFMMMMADHGVGELITAFDTGLESLGEGYYVLMIPRTQHNSFVDAPFWVPLVIDGALPEGTGAAQIALMDYRLYINAFFDKHLRGLDVPLLDGASDEHPEVFFLNREEPVTPPTADAEPQTAIAGEGNEGDVTVGTADVWHYEAQAGDVVDILLLAERPADKADQEQRDLYGLFDTLLVVRAPDGSLLAANDDMGGGFTNSALEGLVLPDDGTYTIEVRSWANLTGGPYTLAIKPVEANE